MNNIKIKLLIILKILNNKLNTKKKIFYLIQQITKNFKRINNMIRLTKN